jgi:hypothetical protein
MKILFIAARFHPNQISLVKKLLEEGHQIEFLVMGKGNSEDYSTITPKEIPISILTRKYIQYFKKNIDIAEFQNIAIPKLTGYYSMIRKFNPDVMIIRGGQNLYIPGFYFLFSFLK